MPGDEREQRKGRQRMKNRMPIKPLLPSVAFWTRSGWIVCLLFLVCLALPGCLRKRYDTSIPYSKYGYDLSFRGDTKLILRDSRYYYSTGFRGWNILNLNGGSVDNGMRKFGILTLRLKMSDGRTHNEEIDLLPLVENMKKNNNIFDILFGPMEEIITKQYDDHIRKYGFSWYAMTWQELNVVQQLKQGNYAPPPIE